jgi:hypothetical protein
MYVYTPLTIHVIYMKYKNKWPIDQLLFFLTNIVGLLVLDWQKLITQNVFWRPFRRHKQCGAGLNGRIWLWNNSPALFVLSIFEI